ncbi:metalloreductase STEAP4-like [Oratosquilla oratoria]|uniref:metalloreductase STEAP4-like n=1 Tax=Oratosquilla oratoria TaxID=337810 RepID=UPI003F777477
MQSRKCTKESDRAPLVDNIIDFDSESTTAASSGISSDGSFANDIIVGGEEASEREASLNNVFRRQDSGSTLSDDRGIVIVGSGDFGRALAHRLCQMGLGGVVASRQPERNRELVENCGGTIGTYEELLPTGRIVILAVPQESYSQLPAHLLQNKILVDVSNRNLDEKARSKSNAETLQELFPRSWVVKAFNTLSAYALERGAIQGSKEVPICGNNPEARATIAQLVRDLGFQPVDSGGLGGAVQIEEQPLRFFSPEWKYAFKMTAILFSLVWIFFLFRIQLCRGLTEGKWAMYRFEWIPLTNTQLTLGVVATMELALCYLPGVFAAYLQLWRGTKYSRFPNWLDKWLRSRKQIGLAMLFLGTVHGCMAILQEMGSKMSNSWYDGCYLAAGVLLVGILMILGVTSLPSVTATMSWREFTFVQSRLGWLCLVLVCFHVSLISWPRFFKAGFLCYFLPKGSQLSLFLPGLTLLLKMPLLLPCVDAKLTKIRKGYEKVAPNYVEPV